MQARPLSTAFLALMLGTGSFAATACGGGNEVGERNDDAGAVTSEETPTTAPPPQPAPQEETKEALPEETATEEEEDSLFDDGRQDVTLQSCRIGDPYDLGDSVAIADLKIKNSSSKVSDYSIEIEITDAATGNRLDTLLAGASKVAPGQTVDTGNGDGEEDANGTDKQIHTKIKCSILSADRIASVE
ncbi:hypothetical protein [Streptomyces sp. NPDC000877]|uniref:hypothetical protein n=1 Tax=unclassified Streptomyces TaxID=2593676 RepID=UPI00331BCA5B